MNYIDFEITKKDLLESGKFNSNKIGNQKAEKRNFSSNFQLLYAR